MTAPETLSPLAAHLDTLLRGGTISILLLLVAHLLFHPKKSEPIIVTGLIFCVSGVFEAIFHAPAFIALQPLPTLVTLAIQQVHFISLWLFILSMFDDGFAWRPQQAAPPLVAAVLVAVASSAGETVATLARGGIALLDSILLFQILRLAAADQATDLVDSRRAFRRVLTFTVPPFSLLVVIASLVHEEILAEDMVCLLYAGVFFALGLGFTFWLTRLEADLVLKPEAGAEIAADEEALSAADKLELDRVLNAMAGGLYLEPGLSIGSLGDILKIPEHRLRRLINRGLGYRNFAAFVNDYRIEEAKRRLADPELAREQIIQHAFSLGYSSLAPFNRAFRERVGVSPTEYRETALAGLAA
jgi:AraC-type DNA-binding domain-containing proteins